MREIIRKSNLDDTNRGLLDVYTVGYNFHRDGRNDIFINL